MSKRCVLAVALAGLMAPLSAKADCGTVSVAEMNWTSGRIITGVAAFLMEQGYGCDVVVVPSATTTAVTSLAENNEPDVIPELWPNGAPAYFRLEEEGRVVKASDAFSAGGTEHWLVPSYLVEEHPELATIEGILENPELVGGRFHSCPDGWGCRNANDALVEAYDFESHGIEVFHHGSGETLMAALVSAYESGEPYFGYYWGPTAPLGKYDLVSVDMGPVDQETYECNLDVDCDDIGKTAWPSSPVYNVVTTDLAEREPAVFELMQRLSFDNSEMNELLAWHSDNNATVDEAVVHFLQNRPDMWMSWLSEDARANLQDML